jgi:hypothetical protein
MTALALPDTSLDLSRPFTRADAIRVGLDPKLLRGSRFRRLFRGVYVLRSTPVNPFLRTQAALALHSPAAFASHTSAARAYELPVPSLAAEHISVLRQQDRRSRSGIVVHVAPADARVRIVAGSRVSAPLQMFVELASLLALVDLVVVGDALVRMFRITVEDLRAWCADSQDPHAPEARLAAAYVRAEVDSPMETRLRMLIVLAGLPEPRVNHILYDSRGRVRVRLDLSYPLPKLIVEYDGRQHADDPAQWKRDLERREFFDDEEWRILVVTSDGIYREPEQTLMRVRRALVSRGCPGVPRHLSEAWRPHFQVR